MPYKGKGIALRSSLVWLSAIMLVAAAILPLLAASPAEAAQVTVRSIDMDTSEPDAESGSTVINFTVPDNGTEDIGSFIVEFCDNDPLPGETCTFDGDGDDIPEVDSTAGSIVTMSAGSFNGGTTCTSLTLTAPSADDNHLEFNCNVAVDISGDAVFTATIDDMDLPDNSTDGGAGNHNNTFYARLYTFAATDATYANPQTGYNNEGGVALSTAQVITVNARVQETLEFCVGTTITTTGDCTTVSGTTIDMGVLSPTAVTRSSGAVDTTGTCNITGGECAFLVASTNATDDGVFIDYKADSFDVAATCPTGTSTDNSSTDQCFDPVHESAETTITAGDEGWGIAVINSTAHASSQTTNNLQQTTDVAGAYDYQSTGYAVDDSDTATAFAQSDLSATNTPLVRVVDREQLEVEIAASIAYTTPSGLYSTTLEFIATGMF